MLKAAMRSIIGGILIVAAVTVTAQAEGCADKLFSVTINNSLTIGDALDNLAETCGLTVTVKDSGAQHRLKKKLYYVKLKNSTLKSFLDTLLKDNDLNYTLKGNKLTISYLVTRTFRVHYISGDRKGSSSANVTIAGASDSSNESGGKSNNSQSRTGIEITSDDAFKFWSTVKDEVHRILVTAGDGSTHYTKVGDAWIGPDGQKWEYNPVEPIINPEAGMITVTGTARQIERVGKYIASLARQIKTQVMIDVKILAVKLDNSHSTGIDWSQLYGLQNVTVDAVAFTGHNVGDVTYDNSGITEYGRLGKPTTATPGGGFMQARMHATVSEVIKFLHTQGDVRAISSPRVMTMNNQPAMISVGREIYYKLRSTSAANSGGDNVAQDEQVNSVFAGILLDITPEIDERGMVTLKINPSISETAEPLTDIGTRTMPPDLIRRQIASVIKVKDGDHAILGGLITRGKGTKSNKVPLLGDLPLIGYAFKRDEVIDKTEELVVIITPHIVKNGKGISLKEMGYSRLK